MCGYFSGSVTLISVSLMFRYCERRTRLILNWNSLNICLYFNKAGCAAIPDQLSVMFHRCCTIDIKNVMSYHINYTAHMLDFNRTWYIERKVLNVPQVIFELHHNIFANQGLEERVEELRNEMFECYIQIKAWYKSKRLSNDMKIWFKMWYTVQRYTQWAKPCNCIH